MTAKSRIKEAATSSVDREQRRIRKRQRNLEVATLQATAFNEPSALLHIATVSAAVGLGVTAIYDRIRAGTFPAPIRLSARCSRWRSGDVRGWLASQTPTGVALDDTAGRGPTPASIAQRGRGDAT